MEPINFNENLNQYKEEAFNHPEECRLEQKIVRFVNEEGQFEKLFNLCNQGRWKEIDISSVTKLKDLQNRSLYQAFVEEGDESALNQLSDNLEIIEALSDGQYRYGIHYAASKNRPTLFNVLEKIGCHYNKKNDQGKRPIYIAIEFGCVDSLTQLLKKQASTKARFIDKENSINFSPLSYAVFKGKFECVDILIANPDVSLNERIENIGNLLHLCIQYKQIDMLQNLLVKYPNKIKSCIKGENAKGQTPLSLAASLGDMKAISLLVGKGANIGTKDHTEKTPLHHAVMNKQRHAVHLLVSLGADINSKDIKNKCPLDYIREQKDIQSRCIATFLTNESRIQESQKNTPPDMINNHPENLVFQGGGPRGLAYIGVLEALEGLSLMNDVKRVAGTSAGAITALLLSLGFNSKDMRQFSEKYPLTDLLDYKGSEKLLTEILLLDDDSKNLGFCGKFFKGLQNTFEYCKLFDYLQKGLGICEGEKFRSLVGEVIKERTGYENFTFGDLKQEIEKGDSPYKHLHVSGTRVGPNIGIVRFSSEDKKWHSLIIADVIRLSMSIPILFKPHHLYFRSTI